MLEISWERRMLQIAAETEGQIDQDMISAQEMALERLEKALDACGQAPECPTSGAPICSESLSELTAAKEAARNLGLTL